MEDKEARYLVGCCGLYCGLCSKYQSTAPSRCTGCKQGEQHAWCSIWVCCVKKHGYETCSECMEIFDCVIFLRRNVAMWIPAADNLRQIREAGFETWLEEQKERQGLLELLLQNYNEGRSMSLYCKACTRMPVDLVCEAVADANERIAGDRVEPTDGKAKARIFKSVIHELASERNINLK